jgi:O-antigen ligase
VKAINRVFVLFAKFTKLGKLGKFTKATNFTKTTAANVIDPANTKSIDPIDPNFPNSDSINSELPNLVSAKNSVANVMNSTSLALLIATASLIATILLTSLPLQLALVLLGSLSLGMLFWQQPEKLAVFWLAAAPLGNYWLRYPTEKALITFDRVVLGLLLIYTLPRLVQPPWPPLRLTKIELTWLAFVLYIVVNTGYHGLFAPPALKLTLDVFLAPLLFFLLARHLLHWDKYYYHLELILIGLSYLLLIIGSYELFTGQDLWAYPGNNLLRDGVIRPNGPYAADNSYALIALMLAVTLYYWPLITARILTRSQRYLQISGIVAALLAAQLSQFRTIGLVMVGSLLIDRALRYGWRTALHWAVISGLILVTLLPLANFVTQTAFFQKRIADPSNAYSRVATYRTALQIAQKNWKVGVGLSEYENYFRQQGFATSLTTPVNRSSTIGSITQPTPHNNFLAIFAELGLLGLLLYLGAFYSMFYQAYRLINGDPKNRLVGILCVLLLLIYNAVGMTLTSGYYADLNLFFFFLLAVILNLANQLLLE